MQHSLIKRGGSKLLVMLPSAIKKSDAPYPYYPRISWVDSIPSAYDCLYITDPYFDESSPFGGSWFINPTTKMFDIDIIGCCIDQYASSYQSVTIYGSSMGGYGALQLSDRGYDKIIAECPQIYLDRYPDSANMLQSKKVDIDAIPTVGEVLSRNKRNKHISICINMSDHHHIDSHLLPFYSALTRTKRPILHIIDCGSEGHAVMSKDRLCKLL